MGVSQGDNSRERLSETGENKREDMPLVGINKIIITEIKDSQSSKMGR